MGAIDNDKQMMEEKYNKAVEAYKQKSADLDTLYRMFDEVRDYRNASKYLDVLDKERTYRKLVKAFKSEDCNWQETAEGFKALGEYKKSAEYCSECLSRIPPKVDEEEKNRKLQEIKQKNEEREAKYQEALKAMHDYRYEHAIKLFTELGPYRDSKEKLEFCKQSQEYWIKNQKKNETNENTKHVVVFIGVFLLVVILIVTCSNL